MATASRLLAFALIALVANFIELLATLIGEDLAMGLVIDVWPAAAEEEKK